MVSSTKKQLSPSLSNSKPMPDVSGWLDQILWNDQGLVPAIAQDKQSRAVLMMACMNRESLTQTMQTGFAHYYSRSRQKLWKKGEESGHLQPVFEIRLDCDGDCVLLLIEQHGGIACHTGRESCFFNQLEHQELPSWRVVLPVIKDRSKQDKNADIKPVLQRQSNVGFSTDQVLQSVFATLQSRQTADPKHSYVAKLLSQGENSVLKKIGEEATELVMAAKDRCLDQVIYETADLWFHSLIALMQQGGHVDHVLTELARREGLSGLAEFASRQATDVPDLEYEKKPEQKTEQVAVSQKNRRRRSSQKSKPTQTQTQE